MNLNAGKKRVCIVATVPMPLKVFMQKHIESLAERYDVTVVCSGAEELRTIFNPTINLVSVDIPRQIAVLRDINALLRLYQLFNMQKFDVVHSLMPKAGLLAMAAAFLARIPQRVHTFTGQVWVTKSGLSKLVLKYLDWALARLATRTLADSPSQREFLIQSKVVNPNRIQVIGNGSVMGVDTTRFRRSMEHRNNIRSDLSLGQKDLLFLFVGRLKRDKGVLDIAAAFSRLAPTYQHLHLMMVGPDEEGIDSELHLLSARFPGRVHRFGFTESPERYMSSADVFLLPSYREGFGTTIIEAACTGLPAIASRIYGITDAVEDGVSGILIRPGCVDSLCRSMAHLIQAPEVIEQMGHNAMLRAHKLFSEKTLVEGFQEFYRETMSAIRE
jgi:glycosyltransferase involved in cell wall biosynthesis